MLGSAAGDVARPRPAVHAEAPPEAFADIDIETALYAFADSPVVAPRVAPTTQLAPPRAPSATQPPTHRWRAAALRSAVALCIGASLALIPPRGPAAVPDARPLAVPADAAPRMATRGMALATADRVRVAAKPVDEPRAGKALPRDEDHIRTTLAELRAAYSQLDAGAAREVWPSVDVDALARAFEGLKAQELRFDHCDVTVDGTRARAACTGEAVYVPRVGGPGSTSAARAWTFELTRRRERWTIASARAI
jgi:hypothetical protein